MCDSVDRGEHGGECHTNNVEASTKAGVMLGRRRRRWPNIRTALDKCFVFEGISC